MKYRKKPVVIEAIQFDGMPSVDEMRSKWGDTFYRSSEYKFISEGLDWVLRIKTLEGEHTANRHDYIIKGVKGEFYPCKPDIFALSYEPASPDEG